MSSSKPLLDTPRLSLRSFEKSDVPRISLLGDDPDVARMIRTMPHPYTEEAATRWLDVTGGLIEAGLLRRFAIIEKKTGLLIGNLTLRKRLATDTDAELSYWIGKPFWGLGYVHEAASAVLADSTFGFGLRSVRAAALHENRRSKRVLEKLGFAFVGDMSVEGTGWKGTVTLATYSLDLH